MLVLLAPTMVLVNLRFPRLRRVRVHGAAAHPRSPRSCSWWAWPRSICRSGGCSAPAKVDVMLAYGITVLPFAGITALDPGLDRRGRLPHPRRGRAPPLGASWLPPSSWVLASTCDRG
ncbi:MAG: hypothetical protein R2692_05515 [Microbacterium sp.]